ncbi:hypothetical protein [Sphingomonas sp.]|uniref:hypothetical protein n=1 Tax=Sphingomonas sp. TaxID=28214 RepID=UPI003340F15F
MAVFMERARAVALGNERYSTISPKDLLRIATNPAMRAEFQREFTGSNDPDFRLQIEQFVLDLADSLDADSQSADRKVDLLDRAGMTIAASVTATGIGATAAAFFTGATAGSLLGPIGTLTGGLIGLVAAAAGRHTLKTRSDESKFAARKLRRLIGRG